ncbi:MAG: hypothetical protein NTX86_03510 [Candidatus Dependentiae bacterium]|nr:hypothetical protein [Candidatus Dependentiae bacterium]
MKVKYYVLAACILMCGQVQASFFSDIVNTIYNTVVTVASDLEHVAVSVGNAIVGVTLVPTLEGLMKFVDGVLVIDRNMAVPTTPMASDSRALGLRYNQVAHIKVHNATSTTKKAFGVQNPFNGSTLAYSNLVADQNNSLAEQLHDGLRVFKVPVHPVAFGGVCVPWAAHILQDSEINNAINNSIPSDLRVVLSPVIDQIKSKQWTFDLTNQPLTYALATIKKYLDDNRDAVITLFLNIFDLTQMQQTFLQALDQTGIMQYALAQSTQQPWPTIQDMINSNKRLVLFTDQAALHNLAGYPGLLFADDFVYSGAYSFSSIDELNNDSCSLVAVNPNAAWYRKLSYSNINDDNTLFELNHYITSGIAGSQALAQQANTYASQQAHIGQCKNIIQKLPNLLNLDFYDIGFEDSKRTIRELQDGIIAALQAAQPTPPQPVPTQPSLTPAQSAAVSAAQGAIPVAQNPGNAIFFNAGGVVQLVNALQQFINSPTVANGQALLDANMSASNLGNTGPGGFLAVGGVNVLTPLIAYVGPQPTPMSPAQSAAVSAAQGAIPVAQNPGNAIFFNAGGVVQLVNALQQFINFPTVANGQALLDANMSASNLGNTGPNGFLAVGGVGNAFALVTAYVHA